MPPDRVEDRPIIVLIDTYGKKIQKTSCTECAPESCNCSRGILKAAGLGDSARHRKPLSARETKEVNHRQARA
jgi:hypothetical protein